MSDSHSFISASDVEMEFEDNGLMIETASDGLEKVYDYEPGGHHPVHLGDVLHERYLVINKLGSGGYANICLCQDTRQDALKTTPMYVAVKIIMAEASSEECPELRAIKLKDLGLDSGSTEKLCLPLDHFKIDGRNGSHHALVNPVLGPRVTTLLHMSEASNFGAVLRDICFQATQAMSTLHANGICHGDFRPANILIRISGLNGLSKEKVLAIFGDPETTQVVTIDGESHNKDSAPQYLVYPIEWDAVKFDETGITDTNCPCVIDFGESYEISNPPTELGIPQVYCAPENALENQIGIGSDLWALACTLFEIRTGRKIFPGFDGDQDDVSSYCVSAHGTPFQKTNCFARTPYFNASLSPPFRRKYQLKVRSAKQLLNISSYTNSSAECGSEAKHQIYLPS